jgi:hypothetical protein
MNHTLYRFFLATSLMAIPAFCQNPPDPNPTGSAEQPLFDYSLSFDTYSETKLNGNFSSSNLLRNFDITSDHFDLAAATLTMQITKGQFGLHVDTGYGDVYKTMNSLDPWGGANRYFGQAYVSYRPFKSSDFDLDFGKFYTSVGAEVPDASANPQYSRSLLFTLGSPYYHFGLRASKSVTPAWVIGAQVVNGWNDVSNNTGGQTLGLTATYTKKLFNLTETYLVGPEPVFQSLSGQDLLIRPKRTSQLIDSVLKLTPNTRLNGYVETLYCEEKNVSGRDSWYGVAASATLPIVNRWSVSPRWEFYNDVTGATSGVVQKLQELTTTVQYQPPVKNLLIRAELRGDFSDTPFFLTESTTKSKKQETALLAVLYTWKGKK